MKGGMNMAKIGDIIILENGDKMKLVLWDEHNFETVLVGNEGIYIKVYPKEKLDTFIGGFEVLGSDLGKHKIIDIVCGRTNQRLSEMTEQQLGEYHYSLKSRKTPPNSEIFESNGKKYTREQVQELLNWHSR
jgi:hypothetical protein